MVSLVACPCARCSKGELVWEYCKLMCCCLPCARFPNKCKGLTRDDAPPRKLSHATTKTPAIPRYHYLVLQRLERRDIRVENWSFEPFGLSSLDALKTTNANHKGEKPVLKLPSCSHQFHAHSTRPCPSCFIRRPCLFCDGRRKDHLVHRRSQNARSKSPQQISSPHRQTTTYHNS